LHAPGMDRIGTAGEVMRGVRAESPPITKSFALVILAIGEPRLAPGSIRAGGRADWMACRYAWPCPARYSSAPRLFLGNRKTLADPTQENAT
jgi:hypothetical protein